MPKVAFSVDLLFLTGNTDEPGSMNVRLIEPKDKNVLTIVIEVDSSTPIKENITSIISFMQKDIFSRIGTDAIKEASIFLDTKSHTSEFPSCDFVKLTFDGNNYNYIKVDEIDY